MKYLKMYMVMLMGVTITEFSFADIARWTDPETGLEWTYWEYPSYSDWHDRVSIGGGDNTVPALPRTTSGRVIIPSEIAGKRVFDVGFHAFAYCDKITSIVIPPSVNSISASAFLGCSALSSVGLPEGLKTIDMYAFKDCIQLKDLEFPATIVEIGPEAFENCKEIDRVELPDGIERIGGFEYYTISESAFRGCTGIRDVSIAKSLSVGKLFGSCYTAITNVTVRGGEQIGPQDFKECAQLERVFLPHGLQSIGTEAFYKCKKLTELHIPATVTNISAAAFEYCECVHELVLPECLSEIGREAFGYCTGLVSVTMPTHLDKIENDLFIDCNALSEVNIRDLNGWCSQDFPFFRANPLHYAHNGFVNNVCLTNLEIPNVTERIGTYAFSGVNVAFVLVPQSV